MESAPVISNNHHAAQKIIIDTDPGIGKDFLFFFFLFGFPIFCLT